MRAPDSNHKHRGNSTISAGLNNTIKHTHLTTTLPTTTARARKPAVEQALQLLARTKNCTQQRREAKTVRARGYKQQYQGCGYNKKLPPEQFEQVVLKPHPLRCHGFWLHHHLREANREANKGISV